MSVLLHFHWYIYTSVMYYCLIILCVKDKYHLYLQLCPFRAMCSLNNVVSTYLNAAFT